MTAPEPTGTDKISVSLPRGTRAALEAAVAAGAAPSVSALVASAVDDRLARERTHRWIMDRRGGRPIDPAAMAWARQVCGADEQDAGQASA